jgi:hypothetical protein
MHVCISILVAVALALCTAGSACAESSASLMWDRLYDGPDHLPDLGKAVAVDHEGNVYVGGYSESEIPFACGWQDWHGESASHVWTDPAPRFGPGGTEYFVRFTATAQCTLRAVQFLYGCGGGFLEPTVIVRVYGSNGPESGGRMYPDDSPEGSNFLGDVSVGSVGLSCYPNWTSVDLTSLGPLVFQGGEEFFITLSKDPLSPPLAGDTATLYSDDGSSGFGRSGYYDRTAGDFLYFDEVGADYGLFTEAHICCGALPRRDFVTVKYDALGNEQWVNRYDGTPHHLDEVMALTVDANGYVYATGYTIDPVDDMQALTVKYHPDGDTLWARRFNGAPNDPDVGYDLVVDEFGNVYVTGRSDAPNLYPDVITIKYNSDGDLLWWQKYGGAGDEWDVGRQIALDGHGGVYVGATGTPVSGDDDFLFIKYDVNGIVQWMHFHDGPAGDRDILKAMDLDAEGSIYAAGESYGAASIGWIVVKYDSGGVFHWERIVEGYDNTWNRATAIAMDEALGYVRVAGWAETLDEDRDILALTLDPVIGEVLYGSNYGSPSGGEDEATALALGPDSSGFYVTGRAAGDCVTLKFAFNNDLESVWRYSSPYAGAARGEDITVDDDGNVIVAGYCWAADSATDYLTLKYGDGCFCPYQCDYDEDGFVTSLDLGTLIDVLFAGLTDEQDPACPTTRGDFDNDGYTTALDLSGMIDHLFVSGPPPVDPCGP